jgi:hypothetical protein
VLDDTATAVAVPGTNTIPAAVDVADAAADDPVILPTVTPVATAAAAARPVILSMTRATEPETAAAVDTPELVDDEVATPVAVDTEP